MSGRAPVASRPEGRRVREGLGVTLASGRAGPVPPPWPRDGGAAQALLSCACCPADSSAVGCAATSKANFAVTEPPPVLGASPEAAGPFFGRSTKAVFLGNVKTIACLNIEQNETEVGFFFSV